MFIRRKYLENYSTKLDEIQIRYVHNSVKSENVIRHILVVLELKGINRKYLIKNIITVN